MNKKDQASSSKFNKAEAFKLQYKKQDSFFKCRDYILN